MLKKIATAVIVSSLIVGTPAMANGWGSDYKNHSQKRWKFSQQQLYHHQRTHPNVQIQGNIGNTSPTIYRHHCGVHCTARGRVVNPHNLPPNTRIVNRGQTYQQYYGYRAPHGTIVRGVLPLTIISETIRAWSYSTYGPPPCDPIIDPFCS